VQDVPGQSGQSGQSGGNAMLQPGQISASCIEISAGADGNLRPPEQSE
jgi:hypothetical protein